MIQFTSFRELIQGLLRQSILAVDAATVAGFRAEEQLNSRAIFARLLRDELGGDCFAGGLTQHLKLEARD